MYLISCENIYITLINKNKMDNYIISNRNNDMLAIDSKVKNNNFRQIYFT
jgi:hypothetical protein